MAYVHVVTKAVSNILLFSSEKYVILRLVFMFIYYFQNARINSTVSIDGLVLTIPECQEGNLIEASRKYELIKVYPLFLSYNCECLTLKIKIY